jgi:hypothetical protein
MTPSLRCLLVAVSAAFLAGACHREDVHVALQPRDQPAEPAPASASAEPGPASGPAADADAAPPMARPHPHFTWKLPEGWQESGPGQMSVASFQIKSDAGQATVNITPLPNLAGKEPLLVNMWREQVGAPPLAEDAARKSLTEVEVAGQKGQLFEVTGASDGKPMQIVTAIAQAGNASWFYKLSGDQAVVAAQKPAFLEFLKSVRMQEAAPDSPDSTHPQS